MLSTYIRARVFHSTNACAKLVERNPRHRSMAEKIIRAKQNSGRFESKTEKYRNLLLEISWANSMSVFSRSPSQITRCSISAYQGRSGAGVVEADSAKGLNSSREEPDNTSHFSIGSEEREILDKDDELVGNCPSVIDKTEFPMTHDVMLAWDKKLSVMKRE